MSNGDDSRSGSRMEQIEAALLNAGNLIVQTSELTQRNARQIDRNDERIEQQAVRLDQLLSIQSDILNNLAQTSEITRRNARQLEQTSEITQRNARRIEQTSENLDRASEMTIEFRADMRRLTEKIDALTTRVDSLAAASERHDASLDYLIKRDRRDED